MQKRIRQKRRDGLKRQAEIMAIALELFSNRGFHATSVDDIIGAAGVAKGTFYLHFNGKSDILMMIIDSYLAKIYSSLLDLDISMDKPVEDMKRMYYDVTDFFISFPDMKRFIKLMLRDAIASDEVIKSKVNNYFSQIIGMSSGYIKKAQREGRVVASIDPRACAVSIIGGVKELLYRWAVLEEDLDVRRCVATMVDVFFRGMLV